MHTFCEEYRQKEENRFGKDTNKAMTWTFAKRKAGGEAELKDAIRTGEVDIIHNEVGIAFYKWQVLETGTINSSKKVQKVGGKQDISREMLEEASKQLDSLSWSFKPTNVEQKELMDGSIPQTVQDKMNDIVKKAKGLVDDAVRTRKLLGNIVGQENKRDQIMSEIGELQDALPPLMKALSLDELPRGTTALEIRDMLGRPIKCLKALYVSVSEAKGTIKALVPNAD
jgi:hypothetical protein